MDPHRYVLKQRQADGTVWTSPEVFRGDINAVKRAVIAGYLAGFARWAETDCGMFLFGIDRRGTASGTGAIWPGDFQDD